MVEGGGRGVLPWYLDPIADPSKNDGPAIETPPLVQVGA